MARNNEQKQNKFAILKGLPSQNLVNSSTAKKTCV